MGQHGGLRPNSGRKSRAEEVRLAEMMDEVADPKTVIQKLWDIATKGDIQALKLWASYRFGMPKQSIDHTTNGESINIAPIQWVNSNAEDQQ